MQSIGSSLITRCFVEGELQLAGFEEGIERVYRLAACQQVAYQRRNLAKAADHQPIRTLAESHGAVRVSGRTPVRFTRKGVGLLEVGTDEESPIGIRRHDDEPDSRRSGGIRGAVRASVPPWRWQRPRIPLWRQRFGRTAYWNRS